MNRPLTGAEEQLVRWMLEHGKPEARAFLPQLALAQVAPWRCPCGCASMDFFIPGFPEPTGGINPLGSFSFGSNDDLSGIFIFEQSGVLAGLEVYGLDGDAPKVLPWPDALRPFPDTLNAAPTKPKPFHNVNKPTEKQPTYRCPCCGFLTLCGRSGFEICPVCFWEDDGQDDHDADEVRGGPNGKLSLTQARENYRRCGAADKGHLPSIRKPLSTEI